MKRPLVKAIPLIYVGIYITISHVILPVFNHNEDFFIFSLWRLFEQPPREEFFDASCDNGKTFLIKDHSDFLRDNNPVYEKLMYHIANDEFRNYTIAQLHKLLNARIDCPSFIVHRLQGPIYKYVLFKENVNILEVIK